MGCYAYVSRLLDEVEGHSTVIGRVWMNSLFVFRVLVLGAAASLVWWDEHDLFICNTQQPGCANSCYDAAFPISLVRFWVIQVLCVSAPTLVHVLYAVYAVHQEDKQERTKSPPVEVEMVESPSKTDNTVQVNRRTPLLQHYLIRMCFKIILELAFVICQYVFVGFVMNSEIKCPCSSSVDCFVPRSTEKTIFSIFMAALACVSLLLNVAEVTYSLCTRKGRKDKSSPPRSSSVPDS
ncbi:hypothetical protein ACEWY4_021737 [Coilia grayii]|uniref:Gap junction protein n=1 Tax=Coilia grayii TaxID=363190 RepID=A0ABD1J413_9TELE